MKLKYTIDKNNRLTIVKGKALLNPDGYFTVEGDNHLVYKIKEPGSWRRQNHMPERLVLTGKWAIDTNHNLIFNLRKTDTQAGNQRLVLKGDLAQAKSNTLIFSLGTQGRKGTHRFRLLQLKGRWQADRFNRLQFLAKKLKSASDTLTFQGDWQVKNNNLIYTYKETSLKTKAKHQHSLRFKGYWQIKGRNRITYILDAKNNSSFDFRAYLETPSLIGKRGVIKYRVGIGVRGSRLFKYEAVALYGVWKFHRKAGLSFDINYGRGCIKAINFGTFVRTGKSKVAFKVKTRKGKDLGIRAEFSRQFLKKNAEWFLRMVQEKGNTGFKWGINSAW